MRVGDRVITQYPDPRFAHITGRTGTIVGFEEFFEQFKIRLDVAAQFKGEAIPHVWAKPDELVVSNPHPEGWIDREDGGW